MVQLRGRTLGTRKIDHKPQVMCLNASDYGTILTIKPPCMGYGSMTGNVPCGTSTLGDSARVHVLTR